MKQSALRIHSWGGFGSQLNALAFALEVQEIYPNRKLQIVIHTGGVTKRDFELNSIIPISIDVEIVDDYTPKKVSSEPAQRLRNLSKVFLELSRLIVSPNSTLDLVRLKPWTISSRGHYAYILHSPQVLQRISQLLGIDGAGTATSSRSLIHYRLGDLLQLDKGFTQPSSILQLLSTLHEDNWYIASDSIEEARRLLQGGFREPELIRFENLSSLQVVRFGVLAENFIGTNSKLSIWIAILRAFKRKPNTYIPSSMKRNLQLTIPKADSELIKYY